MNLEEARKRFREGKITFAELDIIFYKKASESEKEELWRANTWDRPLIIEGKTQSQRNQEWNKLINN